MKRVARLYKWIVISFMIQVIILTYFDYNYRIGDTTVQVSNFGVYEKLDQDVRLSIPPGVQVVRTSFNGLYTAYMEGGKLEIISLKNRKKIKSIVHRQGGITYFRWLPDRDIIIYAIRSTVENKGSIQIFTLDLHTGITSEYPAIQQLPKGSEVLAIELSTYTNIVYVKVKTQGEQAQIYKFDIMSELSYVMDASIHTTIKEATFEDQFVYQNGNQIYVRSASKNTALSPKFQNRSMVLLDVDLDDTVYIAEQDGQGRLQKIHFGKLRGETVEKWSEVSIKTPCLSKDIFITSNGSIYQKIEAHQELVGINHNGTVAYSGEFIEILDGYVMMREENELILKIVR